MATSWTVRVADEGDVAAVCQFGRDFVRDHYAPLIGRSAADAQVRVWWNETSIGTAIQDELVIVAEEDDRVIGVAQRGRWEGEHVVWKLYLHPARRGLGLGPCLIEELTNQLPPGTDRLFIEHFAGNERAGLFYEREGFAVDRIEQSPTGDRALDTVWRVRDLSDRRQVAHPGTANADRPR
jgi:GNAT superfamily N-acetyltransferase